MKQVIFQLHTNHKDGTYSETVEMYPYPARVSFYDGNFIVEGETLFKSSLKDAIGICREIAGDIPAFHFWIDETGTLTKWGTFIPA